MDVVNLAPLLEAGVHGLLVIVLLIAWYERREMRKDQFELIKLLLALNPEAAHLVPKSLKRKVQVEKLNGE